MKRKKARQPGGPPAGRVPAQAGAGSGALAPCQGEAATASLPWWKRGWLFGLLVLVATVAAYQPAWQAGFIWDDDIYVSNNPLLTAPDGLRRIWFSLDLPSQYFPLTYTLFRIERALFALHAGGFHWVNILLHAVNALLVWKVLRRLSVPGARLAALIFALHPVQVESVAWITELKNLLSLCFSLLAVLAWLEFVEGRAGRLWRFYLCSLGLYLLALLSKSTACTLPAALLLVLWLRGLPLTRRRVAQVLPFVVLGVGMGLLAIWWERYHQGTEGASFGLGPLERLLIASHAIWFYAAKLAWPAHLSFSYPRWNIQPGDPLAYGWLAALAAVALLIYAARRRLGRGVEVAALFYVATLSPVLGFIMLYTFEYSFVADHYQYAACIGPIALAAAGLTWAWRRWGGGKPFPGGLLCAVLALLLGALSWRQSGTYADAETLWRSTLENNPESTLAHNNLGNLLLERGEVDNAVAHFRAALAIRPDFAESHSNLGNALARQGHVREAMQEYQAALKLRPDLPEVHNNLAGLLAGQNQVDAAVEQYQTALKLRPGFADAHSNLGLLLLRRGRTEEALPHLRKAVELRPGVATAQNSLGLALLERGELDEALPHFQQALALQPDLATAQNNLGTLLYQKGQLDPALARFQKALELQPGFAEAANNAGQVLLRQGRLDEAIPAFRRALEIRPDFVLARTNLGKAMLQKGP